MEITVQTRHLEIPDQLREAAVAKAAHLERFLDGSQLAEVIFSRDHAARDDGYVTCEVLVIARGRSVRVRAKAHLAKDALEAAMGKEALRLTRMQDRLVHRSRPRHGVSEKRPTELAD
ncbi:MAG: HPF/RaiA family ribosome-associated protein [Acidimicrobiales bacterium]|jgi:ribosomal subunit interface protein